MAKKDEKDTSTDDDRITKLEQELERLRKANETKLDEIKKLKNSRKEEDDELEELRKKAEAHDKAEEEALKEAGKYKDLLEKAQEKHEKEIAKLTGELEAERKMGTDMLIENNLSAELAKANVAEKFLPAVLSLMRPRAKVDGEGNDRSVVVGDKKLGEYLKEWAGSDEGKAFIEEPASGGGSTSGDASPGSTTPPTGSENLTELHKAQAASRP